MIQSMYTVLHGGWHYTSIINKGVVRVVWGIGYNIIYKGIDRGILEKVGPMGIKEIVIRVVGEISYIQGGKVYNYILIMGVYLSMGIWGVM